MTLAQVDAFLNAVMFDHPSELEVQTLLHIVQTDKVCAVSSRDQNLAKILWTREQSLDALNQYLMAYRLLRDGKYYDAWCKLERCEIIIQFLRRHLSAELWFKFPLEFIDTQVKRYQSIYPYRLFFSPEIVELEMECTICGANITPRRHCGHDVGEIYNGEMCCRKITRSELLTVAMVEDPVQKYSVPFMSDPKTGKSVDQYKYSLLEYLMPRLDSAYDSWDVKDTTRIHPHQRFSFVGRNDLCPCGSTKKYKKCCFLKSGVTMPHKEFILPKAPPSHLTNSVIIMDAPKRKGA